MKGQRIFGANRLNANLTIRDGAGNFIVCYLLQIILQFLLTLVLMATDVSDTFQTTVAYTCLLCSINEISIISAPTLYSKVLGQNYFKGMGFNKKVSVVQVLLLIVIAILMVCAFAPIANYFVNFIYWTGFDASKISTLTVKTVPELIASIVFVALVPSVCEEITYRGMIGRSFTSKNMIFAIFMSAFLFAIMHGSPVQLVYQFALGAIVCLIFFTTHSIYTAMIVHFVSNTIALVGGYISYVNNITAVNDLVYIIMMLFGLITLPIVLYFFIKISNKDKWIDVKNTKSINEKLKLMFETVEDKQEREDVEKQVEINLSKLETQEAKEVYLEHVKTSKMKNTSTDRKALILAIAFGMFVWIINTILCYI